MFGGSLMEHHVVRADDQEQTSMYQDDRSGIFHADEGTSGCFSSVNVRFNTMICQSKIVRSLSSDILSTYCGEPLMNYSSGIQNPEVYTSSCDGFIYPQDDCCNSPCDDDIEEDASLNLDSVETHSSMDKGRKLDVGDRDQGTLFCEPPCFPSLDLPFLSCYLIHSGGNLQKEYSPLDIRQHTISSMNCYSTNRQFDSTSHGVDGVSKSAAKRFQGTPSILKKRQREFYSPLHDRKYGKKLKGDKNQRKCCSSTMNSSESLDLNVVYDENVFFSPPNHQKNYLGVSTSNKENMDHGGMPSSDGKISDNVSETGPRRNQEADGLVTTNTMDLDGTTKMDT